jgi:hypothetical protein
MMKARLRKIEGLTHSEIKQMIVQNILMNVPNVNDVILWDDIGSYTYDSCVDGFNGFKSL